MKKFVLFLSSLALTVGTAFTARVAHAEELTVSSKSAYLMDYHSGTVLYEKNATTHLPIASMCKIMTLLLCMEEIDAGNLSVDDTVKVSHHASSMGGSQVYIEEGAEYTVGRLLESIVVASANDSCVAMAETIAGSEELFVDRMNTRAKELNANDTLFSNCTGLPRETQYSCAKDVAYMMQALLAHPLYFEYSKIRNDNFPHPGDRVTQMTNTNKLLRTYEGCDSGKTGFTNQAGFCLAASAKRGNMRMISVTIGSDSSAERFDSHKTLLNYAFANYTNKVIADHTVPLSDKLSVLGGKETAISVKTKEDVFSFGKKNEKEEITSELNCGKIKAPVYEGDEIGSITYYKNNVELKTVPLIASETVERASVWDYYKTIAENWSY